MKVRPLHTTAPLRRAVFEVAGSIASPETEVRLVDRQRRKELQERAARQRPPAGVYRIVNRRTGKALLASSTNLDGTRNRFEFARSTASPIGVDLRLRADIEAHGFDAFELEVLDVLDVPDGAGDAEVAADVAALEALWRERYGPAELY